MSSGVECGAAWVCHFFTWFIGQRKFLGIFSPFFLLCLMSYVWKHLRDLNPMNRQLHVKTLQDKPRNKLSPWQSNCHILGLSSSIFFGIYKKTLSRNYHDEPSNGRFVHCRASGIAHCSLNACALISSAFQLPWEYQARPYVAVHESSILCLFFSWNAKKMLYLSLGTVHLKFPRMCCMQQKENRTMYTIIYLTSLWCTKIFISNTQEWALQLPSESSFCLPPLPLPQLLKHTLD